MARAKTARRIGPIHPGAILRRDFLDELGLSPGRVAKACGVPRTRIERLARCETPVTADTALRLEACFGASAKFWLALQTAYDLEVARGALSKALDEIEALHRPEPIQEGADSRSAGMVASGAV